MATVERLWQLTGIPQGTIKDWQSKGWVPKNPSEIEGIKAICHTLKEHAGTAAIRSKTLEEAKLKLIEAQREKLELELAVTRGELVRSAEVVSVWSNYVVATKTKLLGLPSKLAYELAGIDDPIKLQNRLEEEINELLAELSSGKFVNSSRFVEDGGETVQSAATVDGEQLGGQTQEVKPRSKRRTRAVENEPG
jgi:DNA-binding transcriptional MerR regulator